MGEGKRVFIHVEEPSMARAVQVLVPRLLGAMIDFKVFDHSSKARLLADLPQRLLGYRRADRDARVLVLVDRDDDDCLDLKARLEHAAASAGLTTRSGRQGQAPFSVVNRIVVEELEAWFLGDEAALRAAYPRLGEFARRARFRNPDAVAGGTWEALEGLLKDAGYYPRARLPKIEVAGNVSIHMAPEANTSSSFRAFTAGLRSLVDA